jgi:phage shock protein A
MNNFTKTLITGFVVALGATTSAQASDDTFTVVITQDQTVSTEENYSALQEQARKICEQEAKRAGFRKTESSTWLRRKCEKEILTKVIKSSNNPLLTLVHNDTWGVKVKTRTFAQR